MATKKKSAVLSKSTKKKIVKKAKKNKGLTIVILLLIIGVLGFGFYNYLNEKKSYTEFTNSLANFEKDVEIEKSVTNNLELPSSYKGYEIVWESSNEGLINLNGEVTRPEFNDGDKVVTLKAKVNYTGKTFLYSFIKDAIGSEYLLELKVTVKAKEPSDDDYILAVLDNLFMPEETFDSIGFVNKTCYDNVKLSYETSNESIIDNTGKVMNPANDTLVTVTVSCYTDNSTIKRNYDVLVKANDYEIDVVNNNFNSDSVTSKYGDISIDGVNYYNVRVIQEDSFEVSDGETNEFPQYLRLRTNYKATQESQKIAYFETPVLSKPNKLSFKYKFDGSQSSEKGKFLVYVKSGGDYNLVDTITVLIRENYEDVLIDLSSYDSCSVKVEFTHEWSGESFVRIDEVKVTKGLSESEIESSVSLVSNFSRSMFLPFTTKFGGSVTWVSSDTSKITNDGKLVDKATGKVEMVATIKVSGITSVVTFEVNIKENTNSDPLEIYFIDLGVYGLSDCGECTYIKYNDIDIIVDGGDHFESTNKAISDVFEKYTNDKVIDYMIVTHPDSDHIGGVPYLFKTYQVNNLYKFADEYFTTQKFKNLKAAYDSEPNCKVYDIYSDVFNNPNGVDTINISSDIYIKFINTGFLQDKETNGRSVVFELFAYDTKVLMTGDADNGGSHSKLEENYMNSVGDIDVLKVCHHGTENGTTDAFLKAVTPEVAVICNGNYLGNKHGHPNKACLERLNNYSKDLKIYTITGGGLHAENSPSNVNAYRGSCSMEESLVDRNGTINLTIDGNGYTFSCSLKDNIQDLRSSNYWSILFK